MTRRPLPNRRPSATVELRHGGHVFDITIGFDPETGRPAEVFAGCAKIGSGLSHILSDACVWASLLLQHGCAPEALGKSLGAAPDLIAGGEAPASVLGAIAQAVQAAAEARA